MTEKEKLYILRKSCCLCCLQTTSSPKNEFHSILYASFDATCVQELCILFYSLYFIEDFQVHRRGLQVGSGAMVEEVISTWKIALL